MKMIGIVTALSFLSLSTARAEPPIKGTASRVGGWSYSPTKGERSCGASVREHIETKVLPGIVEVHWDSKALWVKDGARSEGLERDDGIIRGGWTSREVLSGGETRIQGLDIAVGDAGILFMRTVMVFDRGEPVFSCADVWIASR